jgi:hypothetical protein
MEDQALSPSYVFAAPPSPSPPISPVGNLDRRHTGRLRKRDSLRTEGGGGGGDGGGAKSYVARDDLVLYKYSILSSPNLSVPRWGGGGWEAGVEVYVYPLLTAYV